MELEALAQLEFVDPLVRALRPRLGEARRHEVARHRLHQRVVQGVQDPERGEARALAGVEPGRRQRHVQRPAHLAFRLRLGRGVLCRRPPASTRHSRAVAATVSHRATLRLDFMLFPPVLSILSHRLAGILALSAAVRKTHHDVAARPERPRQRGHGDDSASPGDTGTPAPRRAIGRASARRGRARGCRRCRRTCRTRRRRGMPAAAQVQGVGGARAHDGHHGHARPHLARHRSTAPHELGRERRGRARLGGADRRHRDRVVREDPHERPAHVLRASRRAACGSSRSRAPSAAARCPRARPPAAWPRRSCACSEL